MKNKTVPCKVMDAVNEFKGEWPYSDSIVMYYYARTNGYGFYSSISKGFSAAGFTSECFNDLVSQLKTNFGKCDTVLAAYYRHVTDKELLTKPSQPVFTQAMADNGESQRKYKLKKRAETKIINELENK